jgi:hypothetical protein
MAAKDVLNAFVITANNYTFYPYDHVIPKESLKRLIGSIKSYFDTAPDLKIEVKRDGLYYGDEKVHSFANDNDPLGGPLFRDGVLWFEVLPDIGSEELEGLLKILCKHRSLNEEPEEDIVTALWNANFPNFRYKAVDSYFDNRPKFDYAAFKTRKSAAAEKEIAAEEGGTHVPKPGGSNAATSLFRVTGAEKKKLQVLVDQDRHRQKDADLVDILIIVLKDSVLETEVSSLLGLVKGEFKEALASAKFDLAVKILSAIKTIFAQNRKKPNNCNRLISDCWIQLSSAEILKPLEQGLSKIDPPQVALFKRAILMLSPSVVTVLARFLNNPAFIQFDPILMEMVGALAARNIAPVEGLLEGKDEEVIKKLIVVIAGTDSPKTPDFLSKLTKHESETIRLMALIELMKKNKVSRENVFGLISDSSHRIRSKVFEYMADRKDGFNEIMMRKYIDNIDPARGDHEHVLMCYRTLGKCGSNNSIDYLKYQLFKRPWLGFLSKRETVHRKGAAIALLELGTAEARSVLESASRSLFPGLRKAYRTARSEFAADSA